MIRFYTEASTLKDLDFLNFPKSRPIIWQSGKWQDVLNLLQFLIVANRVVYSGLSTPRVRTQTLERIGCFDEQMNDPMGGTIFDREDMSPREGYDTPYKDTAVSAASYFFPTLYHNPTVYRNAVKNSEIERAMPTNPDGTLRDPFDHVTEWKAWLKKSKCSDRERNEWLGALCFSDNGEFQGGRAVLYGSMKNEDVRPNLLAFAKENEKLFEDVWFLRSLNVCYRTVYNHTMAGEIKSADAQHPTFYAPNVARGRIFHLNRVQTLNCVHREVCKGAEVEDADSHIKASMRKCWQWNPRMPQFGLLAVEMCRRRVAGSLAEAVVRLRGAIGSATREEIAERLGEWPEISKAWDYSRLSVVRETVNYQNLATALNISMGTASAGVGYLAGRAASVVPELSEVVRDALGILAVPAGALSGMAIGKGSAARIADWVAEKGNPMVRRAFFGGDYALSATWQDVGPRFEDCAKRSMREVFDVRG